MTSSEAGSRVLPATPRSGAGAGAAADKKREAAAGAALGAAARLRVAVPSVADRVAAELRLQLAEGLLLPGARLTESTIAEDLGVSRNTVREAFAELAAERLVVRHPNRGVFVASLEAGDIHDVYAVRRAIEVSAIRGGGSPERVAAVRAAVEEGKAAAAAGDEEALGNANQHFHGAIVALAGSRRLDTIMAQVLAEMRLFFHKATLDAHFYRGWLADNEEICAALEAGDLNRAGDLLLAYLDRSEERQAAVHGD
ncbi:GntR family transcriptional regulator [Arthrobacter sp. H-02-3]|uniref:GntR family transcriptional regulator n=1 Tax=Arthrobacter sp. H-02-3 TaxID=2703675 RepID=UPI001F1FA75A|nr:GntR family transcriptional regulator [Arthrobacter sp. H-02-3]